MIDKLIDNLIKWINLHPVLSRFCTLILGTYFLYNIGYAVGKFLYHIFH